MKKQVIEEENIGNYDKLIDDVKFVLNKLNLYHYQVNHYLTPHLIVIEIKSFLKIDYTKLETELSKVILKPYLLKINEDDSLFMIELFKDNIRKISLYEAINLYNDNVMFLGINDHFEVEALNKEYSSVLMFIEKINNLYFYILLSLLKKYKVTVLDLNNELKIFSDYLLYESNIDFINKLIVNVENKVDDEIEVCFINLNRKSIVNDMLDKIRYLIELSKELPIYFVVRLDDYIVKDQYFYNSFNYIMTIDVKKLDVLNLFGFYISNGLKLGEEGLI